MSDDDWEAEFDREAAEEERQKLEAAAVTVTVKKSSHPVNTSKSLKSNNVEPSIFQDDMPLSDTLEERIRVEKRIEEAERMLIGDLLSGCDLTEEAQGLVKDAAKVGRDVPSGHNGRSASTTGGLDGISLKNLTDATKLSHMIGAKIEASPARSAAWLEFMTLILGYCSPKMEIKDLKTLAEKVRIASTKADVDRRMQLQNKKKVNDDVGHQVSHYKEEYDMMFGDVKDKFDFSEEDDGGYDEDDDDFMK